MNLRAYSWTTFVFLAVVLFMEASAALADPVSQSLAALPAAVQDRTREMMRAGVSAEDAFQLVRGMHAQAFSEEQMLRAQSIVLEARREELSARPVINKALEGMAKQVPPERILQAMDDVRSRYAFAFELARPLASSQDQTGRLGNLLAEALAAGLSRQSAADIMTRLRERSGQMRTGELTELAAASLGMARDMARLGVAPGTASEVVTAALSKGFSAHDVNAMHQSLMSQSQSHSPQAVAQGFAAAVQQGQAPQGAGHGGSIGAGSGGAGGSGAGGTGGGSGAGAAGGGSAGGGSGGSGGSGGGGGTGGSGGSGGGGGAGGSGGGGAGSGGGSGGGAGVGSDGGSSGSAGAGSGAGGGAGAGGAAGAGGDGGGSGAGPGVGAGVGIGAGPGAALGEGFGPGPNASVGPGPNASMGPGPNASAASATLAGPGIRTGQPSGYGPGDGSGNQGTGPQDGTGFGAAARR